MITIFSNHCMPAALNLREKQKTVGEVQVLIPAPQATDSLLKQNAISRLAMHGIYRMILSVS